MMAVLNAMLMGVFVAVVLWHARRDEREDWR
jgi:hypothetical protein